jgi:ethanolamine ammonia-lyase small subunit
MDAAPDARMDKWKAAAQDLKVGLDAAREQLRAEHSRSEKLTQLLVDTVAALASANDRVARSDEISEAYSAALTQILTPENPGGETESRP